MNILLVNHTKSLQNAIQQSIGKGDYTIDLAESVENTADGIKRYNSQVVIVNWSKADFNLDALCKKIKRIKLSKYIYILVIADRNDQRRLLSSLDSGINDILFKPFGKEELQIRLLIAKNIIKLEDSVKKFRKDVMKFAKEDPHTNLLNRRSLLDEVLKEMGRASRELKYISAVMGNLTNFKELVEYYGSEAGDGILLECSRRLLASCRPYDKLGRIGISDFLIILPDTGIDNAQIVAQRIMSFMTGKPFVIEGRKINATFSIGLAELNPNDVVKNDHADNHLMNDLILDSLIRRAELALQKAMDTGKNTIESYSFP